MARGRFGSRVCYTDADGAFVFEGLPAGKVLLIVRDFDERGLTVELAEGEDKKIGFACQRPPAERALTGTVLDADRKPLAGVQVSASGQRAVTDAKGAFTIPGVALGRRSFVIRLEPGPGSPAFTKDPHLPRVERKARVGVTLRAS